MDFQSKLNSVFVRVFGKEEAAQITDDCSMKTVVSWDSLTFFSIIEEVEKEFGVSISDEQALTLTSVRNIRSLLQQIVTAQ